MLIAGHAHNCDALIEALTIAKKYLKPGDSPTHCEHDVMYLCIDPSIVSQEDLDRLDELRFTMADTDNFQSYYFGSA